VPPRPLRDLRQDDLARLWPARRRRQGPRPRGPVVSRTRWSTQGQVAEPHHRPI